RDVAPVARTQPPAAPDGGPHGAVVRRGPRPAPTEMSPPRMNDLSSPPADADLHAWVDGRLDPARRAAVQARLAADAQAAQDVAAWAAQKQALRALHAGVAEEAPPSALLQAAMQLQERLDRVAHWQRLGGVAAAVLLAFGVG